MNKLLYFLTLFVCFGCFAAAQPPPSAPPSSNEPRTIYRQPSLKNMLLSEDKYVSLEGRFSIALEKQISGYAGLTQKQLGFDAVGSSLDWRFQEGTANITFLDFGVASPVNDEKSRSLFLKDFGENLRKDTSVKVVKSVLLKIGLNDGKQIEAILPNGKTLFLQCLFAENRFYGVTIQFDPNTLDAETLATKLFETFNIISKSDVEAELKRQAQAIEPKPLPQSPISSTLKSDVVNENLKSKVKKIVEEIESVSETGQSEKRRIFSVIFYDEKGNRTRSEGYGDSKFPTEVTVYGFIDGERVSKTGAIKFEFAPPPPASSTNNPKTPPDLRYDTKYTYKYENGKLIEQEFFTNTNQAGSHVYYSYKKDYLEESIYANNKINRKYVSKLDENGNEVEEIGFDVSKGTPYSDRTYRYIYKYDSIGNWIERTTLRDKKGDGNFVPVNTTFRSIVYFEK